MKLVRRNKGRLRRRYVRGDNDEEEEQRKENQHVCDVSFVIGQGISLCRLQWRWGFGIDIRIFQKLTATPMQLKYNNYTHHNPHSMENKYHLSTEARKSSATQPHRHDILPYINLLDKCTQILREDRIWIRNQLKANDTEIIAIFKEARKPINLQHLQIRLRKYVTSVKSKAKMEQLMKFKQNMHLGQYKQEKPENKKSTSISSNKYQLHQPTIMSRSNNPKFANSNRSAVENSHTSFEKPSQFEPPTNKQEKKSLIYPYRNAQPQEKDHSKEKKNISSMRNANHEYPAPMEEITERESQNMTSARQRINEETLGNASEGFNFGSSYNYTQWRRPEAQVENKNIMKDPLEEIRAQFTKVGIHNGENTMSLKNEMGKLKNNFLLDESSNTKKKFQLDDHYSNDKNSQKEYDGFKERYSRENRRQQIENRSQYRETDQKQNSYQEHSYDHPEFSSYHEQEETEKHARSDNFKQDYCNNQSSYEYQNHENSLHSYHSNNSPPGSSHQHQNQLSEDTNLMYNAPFTYTIPSSSSKTTNKSFDSQNLFTSPQLLAECRNFLKTKSSGKHNHSNLGAKLDIEDSLKPLNLHFQQKNDRFQMPYSNSNFGSNNKPISYNDNSNSLGYTHNLSNDINQGSTLNFYNEITKNTIEHKNRDNYQYFHTFAAQSSQKKPDKENIMINIKPETKVNLNLQEVEHNIIDYGRKSLEEEQEQERHYQQKEEEELFDRHEERRVQKKEYEPEQESAGQLFTAEYFVSFILELVKDQPRGFVYWTTLERAIMQQCPELIDAARDYLYSEEELVMISNIGRVLEDLLQSQPVENDVRNIYKLLDIEQKGFIFAKDIEDFVGQLQESEAQDVETISQLLWKLFDNIDEGLEEGNEKRIDYWGLYSSQMSPQFENLNEILKQFDFQIE